MQAAMTSAAVLGFASSRLNDAPRWSEVTIERNENGYTAVRVGRSLVPGESDLRHEFTSRDPKEIARWFERPTKRGNRLTDVAKRALQEAAEADEVFARKLGDTLVVELYQSTANASSALPVGGNFMWLTLPRENNRVVRFKGRVIGKSSSLRAIGKNNDDSRGNAYVIYAVPDGTYAYTIELVYGAQERPERHLSGIGYTAPELVEILKHRNGWPRAARRALRAAALTDPAFAAAVSLERIDALPHAQMVLRNGKREKVEFNGSRIALLSSRVDGARTFTVVFRTTADAYVVGTSRSHGAPTARVFASADEFVRAFATNPLLLVAAAKNDPAIAALLPRPSAPRPAPPRTDDVLVVTTAAPKPALAANTPGGGPSETTSDETQAAYTAGGPVAPERPASANAGISGSGPSAPDSEIAGGSPPGFGSEPPVQTSE